MEAPPHLIHGHLGYAPCPPSVLCRILQTFLCLTTPTAQVHTCRCGAPCLAYVCVVAARSQACRKSSRVAVSKQRLVGDASWESLGRARGASAQLSLDRHHLDVQLRAYVGACAWVGGGQGALVGGESRVQGGCR